MSKTPVMRVQLIARPTSSPTGTGRYTQNLYHGLQVAGVDAQLTTPTPLPDWLQRATSRMHLDARTFFASYPLRAQLNTADVYHLTSQTLATLLLFQRFKQPVIVTVLDILPYLLRDDPQLNTLRHPADAFFYRLALLGLRRADAWIAISEYTQRTLVETLHLPAEKIHIVYPAIDAQTFRPQPVPEAFRAKYNLAREARYLLYVGSDDPRKNLPLLIRALARAKARLGLVKLIKVGTAHFTHEREQLLALIEALGLKRDTIFVENIPDDELALLYNAVDALVFPSAQEGFGLPVAEAMACGTPVIAARATSLPEIVGDLETTVWPLTEEALADAIQGVLEDPRCQRPRLASVERARAFSPEQVTQAMLAVYQSVSRVSR